jgi:hypothetical protein
MGYRFQTGGQIHGGPVTFLVDGKQHLAFAAGMGLVVFGLRRAARFSVPRFLFPVPSSSLKSSTSPISGTD